MVIEEESQKLKTLENMSFEERLNIVRNKYPKTCKWARAQIQESFDFVTIPIESLAALFQEGPGVTTGTKALNDDLPDILVEHQHQSMEDKEQLTKERDEALKRLEEAESVIIATRNLSSQKCDEWRATLGSTKCMDEAVADIVKERNLLQSMLDCAENRRDLGLTGNDSDKEIKNLHALCDEYVKNWKSAEAKVKELERQLKATRQTSNALSDNEDYGTLLADRNKWKAAFEDLEWRTNMAQIARAKPQSSL